MRKELSSIQKVEVLTEGKHYDLELEAKVLGTMILEFESTSHLFAHILPEMFFDTDYKDIALVVLEMAKNGEYVDVFTVTREYTKQNGRKVENKGVLIDYLLVKVTSDVIGSAGFFSWVLILRELHIEREVFLTTHSGYDSDKSIFDVVGDLRNKFEGLMQIKKSEGWSYGDKLKSDIFERIATAEGKGFDGIPTGFSFIDESNGGFKRGQLITIAARPGVGKSLLMTDLALKAIKQGYKVGLISLEMIATDIMVRMIASYTNIEYWRIDKAQFQNKEERQVFEKSVTEITNMPLYINDTANMNVFTLRSEAVKLIKEKSIDILFLDYLQLVELGESRNRTTSDEIGKISRALKVLAMEFKIPVVALSQLNRDVEKRKGEGRFPVLSDIRSSGSVEQDSDCVMFIHSDYLSGREFDENGNSTENKRTLIVRKWRNGKPNIKADIGFDGSRMKLWELENVNVDYNVSALHKSKKNIDFSSFNDDEDAPF